MTVVQYLRLLRRQWTVVLLGSLCGALLAAGYAYLREPVYQTSVQLFVSTSTRETKSSELAEAGSFTQQRVKSYAELLTSSRVLTPVIQKLRLDISTRDLADKVRATNPIDTVLLKVTVEDTSPVRARDIANAIAAQFPLLVGQLEAAGNSASPVRVSVTEYAMVPDKPISPRKNLVMTFGLFVGLAAGLGVGLLRQSLDRTVTSRDQAADIAGAPVLATVSDDPSAEKSPLIVDDTFSSRAESIRQLRTNIRFLSVDHRLRSLVVTSALPGEGKTSTAANLALSLAQNGEHVVLIDADMRRPTVADLFGLPSGVGLTTVLIGEIDVRAALQEWRTGLPLQVLAAGPIPPNPSELIGSARMARLVETLVRGGATVVIDSPPLLPVTDATILARVTDGALIVTRAGSTHIDQMRAAVESLRTVGAPPLGVVLNRLPRRGRSAHPGYASNYAPVLSSPAILRDPGARPIPAAHPERGRVDPDTPPATVFLPPRHPGYDDYEFPAPAGPQPSATAPGPAGPRRSH